jgi:hypothetical protein
VSPAVFREFVADEPPIAYIPFAAYGASMGRYTRRGDM